FRAGQERSRPSGPAGKQTQHPRRDTRREPHRRRIAEAGQGSPRTEWETNKRNVPRAELAPRSAGEHAEGTDDVAPPAVKLNASQTPQNDRDGAERVFDVEQLANAWTGQERTGGPR